MAGYDIWIWVAVIAVSLLLEFVTMDVTSIWFSVGGLIALILSAVTISFEIQLIVFIVVSALLLLTLRSWARNKLLNSSDGKTNLDLMKEETFKLLTPITKDQKGTVKYNDVVWNAITASGEELEAGTNVVVVEVKGNKLIVKKEGK